MAVQAGASQPFTKPIFSATSKHILEARTFITRFEAYAANIPSWPQSVWHLMIVNCLEGEPLNWYYDSLHMAVSAQEISREQVEDWDEFKRYFFAAYRSETRNSVRMRTFEACKQRNQETVTEFWHRCGAAIKEIYHENAPAALAADFGSTPDPADPTATLLTPGAALLQMVSGSDMAAFTAKAATADGCKSLWNGICKAIRATQAETQGRSKLAVARNMLIAGVQPYLRDTALTSKSTSIPALVKELQEFEGARGMHVRSGNPGAAKIHQVSEGYEEADAAHVDAARTGTPGRGRGRGRGRGGRGGARQPGSADMPPCNFCNRKGHNERDCYTKQNLLAKLRKSEAEKKKSHEETKKTGGSRRHASSVQEDGDDEALFPDYDDGPAPVDDRNDGEVHTLNVHSMRYGIDRVHNLQQRGN